MKKETEINEGEIRVIGDGKLPGGKFRWWIVLGTVCVVLIVSVVIFLALRNNVDKTAGKQAYFEPETVLVSPLVPLSRQSYANAKYVEIIDTLINDIPLTIYIPHNLQSRLHLGELNKKDTSIMFVAQAADIRADNLKILGAFVLEGNPLAWGLSKKGYCAIIDGKITIGVAENTPLFEEATKRNGYFFRQYPLVDNGVLVENEPKNKSTRRSLCSIDDQVFVVGTNDTKESFHDFAQALVDLGVDNAIYIVGSNTYGFAVDNTGNKREFGVESQNNLPSTNYIIFGK